MWRTILRWGTPVINSAIQRIVKNPKSTAAGAAGGVLVPVIAYLETQGCSLSTFDYVGLGAVIFGWGALSTDADKAIVTHADGRVSTVPVDPGPPTAGDDVHVNEGGNSF